LEQDGRSINSMIDTAIKYIFISGIKNEYNMKNIISTKFNVNADFSLIFMILIY